MSVFIYVFAFMGLFYIKIILKMTFYDYVGIKMNILLAEIIIELFIQA